jgi:hypothetical protein
MSRLSVSFKKPVDERYVRPARRSIGLSTSKVAYQVFKNTVWERIDVSEKLMMEFNSRIISPQLSLINVPWKPYRVMEGQVTVRLFNMCMRDAGLRSAPNDPSDSEFKAFFNIHDCRAFVKRLNKMTGLRLSIATETEWEKASKNAGNMLSGNGNWEWTGTKINGINVLSSLYTAGRNFEDQEIRDRGAALRLIEYRCFRPLSSLLRFCVNFKFKKEDPEKS